MLSTGHTDESVAFRCGYLTSSQGLMDSDFSTNFDRSLHKVEEIRKKFNYMISNESILNIFAGM
jgi:hypothetical protein